MKLPSKTIILFIVSITLSLVVGEIVVRNFVTVRNVGPSFSEYDSLYSRWHKRSFSCMRITPEFTMQFSTNSFGSRGPEPVKFPERGILFLGDSFTEGYGVNDGDEYPDIVRRTLARKYGDHAIPVVNLSMGDIGNGIWLKFLRTEGKRFDPRLVVLQLTYNDFEDNVVQNMFSLSANDSLIEHPSLPPGWPRLVQKIIESVPGLSYSYLMGLMRQALWSSQRAPGFASQETMATEDKLTYRILDEIFVLCGREQWHVLIVSVGLEPTRFEKLLELAQQHRLQVINTPSEIHRPDLFYKYDAHWNVRGHQFVANQVLDGITVTGILPN